MPIPVTVVDKADNAVLAVDDAESELVGSADSVSYVGTSRPHRPIHCDDTDPASYPGPLPHVALSFYDANVRDVYTEISLLIDFPIVTDEFVEGLLTIETEDMRLDKALDLIAASSNLGYRFFDDYILVGMNSADTPSWSSLSVSCRYWPRYVDPETLYYSLAEIYQGFVSAPGGAKYLTITAPPGLQQKIQESLLVFDHSPGQVLLELSIMEITQTALEQLGLYWQAKGNSLAQGIISAQPGLIEHLQLLARKGQTRVKAMPSIVSTHGLKAHFSTMQQTNKWSGNQTQDLKDSSDSRRDKHADDKTLSYGVSMDIVPYISGNDMVTLKIQEASVSDLIVDMDGSLSVLAHTISNQVTVQDGEFILLGGMIKQADRKVRAGVPKFVELPLLGWLFGDKKQQSEAFEVWIMIRPSILAERS
ncbi:MAG: hypothetical protein QGG88_08390 [Gammaproteobacteria bacterium]|nr:hypothetical protein [Gammaproteobacteria bacterium]